MCISSIERYLRKYGLTSRKTVKEEDIKQIREMRTDGYSTKQIIELTGYSYSTVNGVLKAAGLVKERKANTDTEDGSLMFTPRVIVYARPRKVQSFKTTLHGKNYIDITEPFMKRLEDTAVHG